MHDWYCHLLLRYASAISFVQQRKVVPSSVKAETVALYDCVDVLVLLLYFSYYLRLRPAATLWSDAHNLVDLLMSDNLVLIYNIIICYLDYLFMFTLSTFEKTRVKLGLTLLQVGKPLACNA